MDPYIVSARKYRPSTFGTVIGQKNLTATLKHAIATGRLAHAYLFCGSRGVGKTSCARIFAKTINCQHRTPEGEACNECDSCRSFNNGSSLNIIELDAASHNGVDDMKSLIEQVQVPPTLGRYRVFIIDEVHMLTSAAFNAFLKTLEEPPEYVVFILATTEKHKIIPTILSRCQIFDFNRITIQDMIDHLAYVASSEGITAETAALNVIARQADGAMRDALSIFDQVAAATMGNVSYKSTIDNLNILDSSYYTRLVQAMLAGDVPQAMLIYREVREKGFDSQFFINGLGLYLRDLMLAYTPQTLSILETSDEDKAALASLAAYCQPQMIYTAMDLCNQADLNFRTATNKQFLIELTLVKLCQIVAPPAQAPQPVQLRPVQAAAQPAPAAAQPQPAMQPQQAQPPLPAQSLPQSQPQPQPQSQPQQHQPAQAYRPAPQTQPPQQAPPAAPRRRSAMPSINTRQHEQQTPADPADDKEDPALQRSAEFTDQDLIKAWTAFAAQHPTERILGSAMQASPPERVDGTRFKATVGDNLQLDILNQFREELLAYLRDTLGNDNLTLEFEIGDKEPSPSTWTQRQVLEHMVEKRPALRDFITTFTMSLS